MQLLQAGSSSGEGWGGKRQRRRGAWLDQAPGRLAAGQTRVALPAEAAREERRPRARGSGLGREQQHTLLVQAIDTQEHAELEENDLNWITAGGSGDTRKGSWQEGNARSGSWREGNAPAWVLSGGTAVPGRRR